jgi:hypothetical protein
MIPIALHKPPQLRRCPHKVLVSDPAVVLGALKLTTLLGKNINGSRIF